MVQPAAARYCFTNLLLDASLHSPHLTNPADFWCCMATASVPPPAVQERRFLIRYLILPLLGIAAASILLWPGLLRNLLSSAYMPHGFCLDWQPSLVWLHVSSDLLTGASYIAISVTLAWLVYRTRRDIPFHWVFVAFGIFIVACGATHLMSVVTLWDAVYWLSGEIKLITAVASVATAIMLPPLVPKILNMLKAAKTSEERKLKLEAANRELNELTARLREMDSIKTAFFANVSHELRTPLALTLGRTEKLLASSSLAQEHRHELEIVRRSARVLLKQVNDLLDVSKLEAGKMALNYSHFDLARLVCRTAANFDSAAAERRIRYMYSGPDSLDAEMDAEKIERILLNLLSNAFKFTPQNGVVRCELRQTGEKATIVVADSGPGVPEEMRLAAFERFRQGNAGLARRFGGTGLGLAIVKDFVELQHGSVSIENAPEGGALFIVVLPLRAPAGLPVSNAQTTESPANAAASEPAAEALEELKFAVPQGSEAAAEVEHGLASTPLVLVIEDNPEMNRFLVENLAGEYRVATAYDGATGLQRALALRPDLVLTDLMMPGMSGDQLVRHLRALPEFDTVPIVVLTAKSDPQQRVEVLRQGAQDYIMKPFPVEELRLRVANLISVSRARRVLQQELESQSEDVQELAEEVSFRKRQLHSALEALRQSESRFRRLSDSNLIGVITLEAGGPLVDANAAFLELLGYTRDELIAGQLNWFDRTSPECRPADLRAIAEIRNTGAPKTWEKEFVRKDGNIVSALVGMALLEGSSGSMAGFVLDLTQQKRADARVALQYAVARALAKSESIAQAASDLLQAIGAHLGAEFGEIWTLDHPARMLSRLQTWRANSNAMLEFESRITTMAEAQDNTLPGRVWRTAAPIWISDFESADFVRSQSARREGIRSAVAFPVCVNDDVLGVFAFFSYRVLRSDADLTQTFTAIGNQVGQFIERKRSELARFQLASIVESSDDAIFSKNLEGVITTWNAAAERMYGYKAEEIMGRPVWVLSPPDRLQEMLDIMERIKHGLRVQHFDTVRITRDGRSLDVALTVSPIWDATGKITGASTIARDITEQKRTETALRNSEKLATVGRVAATVAHEINNPLEAVSNLLYLLEAQSNLPTDVRQYVVMASQEVERIARIVKQTLGFYRESASPVAVNFPQLLDNVVELYSRKFQEKGIRVDKRYGYAGDVPAYPGEMRQVFSNLIVNALEATPKGGALRMHVYASRDWGRPDRCGVRVVVADTGSGIDPANLRHIFEPFFTTKGERGTGLGLWVSQGIVAKHGGSMRLRSSTGPGRSGTVFSVFLPSESALPEDKKGFSQLPDASTEPDSAAD